MADDPERDLIPVREESNYDSRMKAPVSPYPLDEKGHSMLQNHAISKMERYDLEDRFLQIQEENTRLKKQCHQQEDKYKRLAAKLLRLASDRKQRLPTPEQRRDLNTEDVINEQEVRIRELEQLNSNLQDRLVVLKQQLASHSRVHNAAHCGPRSVSRSPSRQRGSGLLSNSDLYRGIPSGESGTLPCDDNAELRAAQEQEKRLMAEITVLRQQMQGMEQEIHLLREQAARHVAEQEEELVNDAMEEKRQKVAENVEMIRMKRLCKQQATQLLAQKAHNQAMERELTQLKQAFELIQKENDDLNEQVLQERKKVSDHQQEVSSLLSLKETVKELREEILDNQRENATLKQHNQQLLALSTNALNSEQTHEKQMMEKVGHLEALLTTERAEKDLAKQHMEEQQLIVNSLQKQLLQQENQCQFLENSLKALTMTSQSGPSVVPPVITGMFKQAGSSAVIDNSSKEGSTLYFSQDSPLLTKRSGSTLPEGFVLYSAAADSASESFNDFNQQISTSVRNKTLVNLSNKDEYYPAYEPGSPSSVSSGSGETSSSPSSLNSNSKSISVSKLKEHKKKVALAEVNRPLRSSPAPSSHGKKLEQKQEVKSPIHEPGGMSCGTSKKTNELNKAVAVPTSKEDNVQVASHVTKVIKSSSGQSKSILKAEKIERSIIQEPVEFNSEFTKNLCSEGKTQEFAWMDAAKRPSSHRGSKIKQNQIDSLIHKPVESLNDTVDNTNELVRTISVQTSEKEAAYHLKLATSSSSGAHASRKKQLQEDIPIREPVELCGTSKYTSEFFRTVVARAHDEDKTQEAVHLETARELEKCRELLRVQYNLNSLYKREVQKLGQKLYKSRFSSSAWKYKI